MEEHDVEQEDDDRDLPDPSDMDDHDEPDLLPCPNCRRMINEDADWCHHCKEYVTLEAPTRSRWRAIVVGAILTTMAAGTIAWFFLR